jgi:phosphatidylinositol alpha 1,6-mannosyltransferase
VSNEAVQTRMTPRVAFFADSFHEVNGVALTCRQFDAYARKNDLPFVSIHAGRETKAEVSGSHKTIELNRGSAAISIESDLAFDPLLWRRGQ